MKYKLSILDKIKNKCDLIFDEELNSPCWLYKNCSCDEYGFYKNIRVDILVYELVYGKNENNRKILHKCDIKACCNPDHLYLKYNFDNGFDRESYFENLKKFIKKRLNCKKNDDLIKDILLDGFINEHIEGVHFAKKLKQIQMNTGKIWEYAIQTYNEFERDTKYGADVISHKRKILIEVKNRYNTDNDVSFKKNCEKLKKCLKDHKDYTCIYGKVNGEDNKSRMYQKNGVMVYEGFIFLEFIFGNKANEIIKFIKKQIENQLL